MMLKSEIFTPFYQFGVDHDKQLVIAEYGSGEDPAVVGKKGQWFSNGADQLKQLKSKGYQAGDVVGRDGVEAAYESVLRGRPRRMTVIR